MSGPESTLVAPVPMQAAQAAQAAQVPSVTKRERTAHALLDGFTAGWSALDRPSAAFFTFDSIHESSCPTPTR